MFQKVNKQEKINQIRGEIKNKVNKFNLVQEEVYQIREDKTKIVQKIIKTSLKT